MQMIMYEKEQCQSESNLQHPLCKSAQKSPHKQHTKMLTSESLPGSEWLRIEGLSEQLQ